MDTKITLESIDSKLNKIDRKIDQKFDAVDRRFDLVEKNISREIRDSSENLRFLLQKVDERLNDKVSYEEHNKLAKRVSDIDFAPA